MTVRPNREQVGSASCYVIDAAAKDGKLTVWIDGDRGYNIVQVEERKQEKGGIKTESLKNVRLEQIDGMWIPVEGDGGGFKRWPPGQAPRIGFGDPNTSPPSPPPSKAEVQKRMANPAFMKSEHHIKLSEVELAPRWAQLNVFVPYDVPVGVLAMVPAVGGWVTWPDVLQVAVGKDIPDSSDKGKSLPERNFRYPDSPDGAAGIPEPPLRIWNDWAGWPAAGNKLPAGAARELKWLPTGVSTYPSELQLSTDDGRTWKTVAEDLKPSQIVRWRVPTTVNSDCRLRVAAIGKPKHAGKGRGRSLVVSDRFAIVPDSPAQPAAGRP
jgi:hypothetical protein